MSTVNNRGIKWQQMAGIGLVCSLALIGCNRADKEDSTESVEAIDEQQAVDNNAVAPLMSCDDPLVQDRVKNALKNTLNQQAQSLAVNYANDTQMSIGSTDIDDKIGSILIDVQNAAILQESNSNGITTCQASVSMTLASEDMYKASQMHTAINKPSLQTRLAQGNIRINNNMLIDDAFSYVVGTQGGQVQARIAGQPVLIAVVADVVAGSAFQSVRDQRAADRQAQGAIQRRENAQRSNEEQAVRQPRAVTPVEPTAPIRQAAPPTVSQSSTPNTANASSSAPSVASNTASVPTVPTKPEVPKIVPSDKSIDMIIIEEDGSTY